MKKTASVMIVATPIVLVASVALWVGYTKLRGYSSNPLTYSSCITEPRASFTGVAGWDFEVEYTNCDALAKDESVSVFAVSSRINKYGASRWLAPRRLVFKYDPGGPLETFPTIRATTANRVLISLPEASSIFSKKSAVGDTDIDYSIGKIDYP